MCDEYMAERKYSLLWSYFSMYLLLWMNVMLDFNCMGLTEQWRTGREWRIQYEIIQGKKVKNNAFQFPAKYRTAREKGRDLTQSYDKSPYTCTNRNVKREPWQHKQRHKKFDYTAVADRLKTASWSNYGHPTGVINLVYGPNFPNSRNSRIIKRTQV